MLFTLISTTSQFIWINLLYLFIPTWGVVKELPVSSAVDPMPVVMIYLDGVEAPTFRKLTTTLISCYIIQKNSYVKSRSNCRIFLPEL